MIPVIFWALVGIFGVIVSIFVIPVVRELFKGPQFLLPFIIFSILGGVLVFLTLKKKVKGKLKKFLILTGASAAGFFIGIFLHNFLYAAAVLTSHIAVLHYLFEVLHAIFFFLAILVCPIGFLVGAVGSAVLLLSKKSKEGR